MTVLQKFIPDFDWSTRRIIINLDPDSAYAIQGGRNDFEPNAVRRIWNWVGNSNWLSGYGSYYGKVGDSDSYATAARTSYPITFQFDANRVVIDPNGTPLRDGQRPRYDLALFSTLARDSWS